MDKPAEFNRIHEEFRDLETVLVDLRTTEESLRKKQPARVFKQQREEAEELVCRVRSAADQINIDVYMFALNRREEDATKVVAARPIGANFRNQYKLPPARNDVSPRVHPASVVFAFEAENAFDPGVSFRADFEQLVSAARKCASPHERVVLLRGRFTSDYAQRTGDTGNGVLSLTTR